MYLGVNMKQNKKNENEAPKKKKKYIKPEIISENLVSFGALCNGTTVGQRKASTGSPNFCNSRRLNS